jgi:hypothetical protein
VEALPTEPFQTLWSFAKRPRLTRTSATRCRKILTAFADKSRPLYFNS